MYSNFQVRDGNRTRLCTQIHLEVCPISVTHTVSCMSLYIFFLFWGNERRRKTKHSAPKYTAIDQNPARPVLKSRCTSGHVVCLTCLITTSDSRSVAPAKKEKQCSIWILQWKTETFYPQNFPQNSTQNSKEILENSQKILYYLYVL